jgi:glucokinase
VGIANPVTGDRVQMTNHHWSFSIEALRQALGFERLRVINDFTALALALPQLPADELRQVGGGAASPGRPSPWWGPAPAWGCPACCRWARAGCRWRARAAM